ncbi:MAG: ClpX C4-type zinc finger protein [Phycisphaerae bacterium]|nr:ClpX C4-type zinc finger protein [Phycisphaerae bacterium]
MRREGTDPNNVQMADVLCDFCHRSWTDDLPLIEGHHGSCVCGFCVTAAYRSVSLDEKDDGIAGYTCTMCLEQRSDPCYRSADHPDAFICRRCIKLAATALEKDDASGWRRPM